MRIPINIRRIFPSPNRLPKHSRYPMEQLQITRKHELNNLIICKRLRRYRRNGVENSVDFRVVLTKHHVGCGSDREKGNNGREWGGRVTVPYDNSRDA